jgi:hypothetical protein
MAGGGGSSSGASTIRGRSINGSASSSLRAGMGTRRGNSSTRAVAPTTTAVSAGLFRRLCSSVVSPSDSRVPVLPGTGADFEAPQRPADLGNSSDGYLGFRGFCNLWLLTLALTRSRQLGDASTNGDPPASLRASPASAWLSSGLTSVRAGLSAARPKVLSFSPLGMAGACALRLPACPPSGARCLSSPASTTNLGRRLEGSGRAENSVRPRSDPELK